MASRIFYRALNLQSGSISLIDYKYSGCVVLSEIVVQYDDELRDEQRQMIIDGIEKRKEELTAELVMLEQRRQELLCIDHKPDQNDVHVPDSEWEDYEPEEGK